METNYSIVKSYSLHFTSYVKVFVSLGVLNKTQFWCTFASHLGACFLTPRRFQPIRVKVMIWFPACCSTSAAGCQEQPEWQWADPHDPLEICPFTHQPTRPPPREGRTRGCHPTPAGPTPRKHRSRQAAGFWCGLLDLYVSRRVSLLECCTLRSGLFVPVVSPFGTGRVCHLQLPSRVMPAGFQQLGGEVFLFFPRAFWKCELAWCPCREVLIILHQPFLLIALSLSWLARIWLRCA